MMLHQALLFTELFDMILWPFPLKHVVNLLNNILDASYIINNVVPKTAGISPMELFTGVKQKLNILKNEHTWGCSAYVFDPKMQDRKKLPKGDILTRQGQYIG